MLLCSPVNEDLKDAIIEKQLIDEALHRLDEAAEGFNQALR